MKKKNGFTLVELIAVIAILAVILGMFVPSLLNSINKNKNEALNKINDLIETATRNYVMDYNISIPTRIELEDLCETTYIECPIINPKTNEELDGYIFVGEDYYYSEEESIELDVNYDSGQTSQTFNENYEPGFTIELNEVVKGGHTFLGWEVVEGNSVIKDNKLTMGTTKTTIKPKFIRYLNDYVKYLYENETTRLSNGLVQTTATYTNMDSQEITVDAGIRYVGPLTGANAVKNQVYFNCEESDGTNEYGSENYNYESSCEVWRIIGVFEVEDENRDKTLRIKIINTNSTFTASWDSSGNDINNGKGVNQWGESIYKDANGVEQPYEGADLMQLLNKYYIGVPGSECKYNNTSGQSEFAQTCDTERNKLKDKKMKPLTFTAKEMIDKAIWYTYGVEHKNPGIDSSMASTAYLQERGMTKKYTGCKNIEKTTTTECTVDNVTRNNEWVGLVGLMSVSDIGYANGWLYKAYPWSISTDMLYYDTTTVWRSGLPNCGGGSSFLAYEVWPSVYLTSNVQITGGDGDDTPYKLAI